MRKNKLFGAVIALGALMSMGQVAQARLPADNSPITGRNEAKQDYKTTIPGRSKKSHVIKTVGGLDLMGAGSGKISMSPRDYGMSIGSGGTKKSNRLRYSHNAKLKRRKAGK